MRDLTAAQGRLLDAIKSLNVTLGMMPTEMQLALYLGKNPSTVHGGLALLRDKGYITTLKNQARSIQFTARD